MVVKELETVLAKDGENSVKIRSFSLSMEDGIVVEVTAVGASITKILVPRYSDSDSTSVDDIVLGYKSPAFRFESGNPPFFGVVVGRVANRIAKGTFEVSGKTYKLDINNDPNHLHGGFYGFGRRVWDAEIVNVEDPEDRTVQTKGVRFSILSKDGDQGYPGTVKVNATYSLVSNSSNGSVLRLAMDAELLDDKATPINMTNHSYFNLSSHNSPNGVLDHLVRLPSNYYTPVDKNIIPTREVKSVESDPSMDLRSGKLLRDALLDFGIKKAGHSEEDMKKYLKGSRFTPDIAICGSSSETPGAACGFDHNYVVLKKKEGLNLAATVDDTESKRRLSVWTDTPGVQFYTANYLDGDSKSLDQNICKDTARYGQWQAFCVETQHYPDSIVDGDGDGRLFTKGKCVILRPESPKYSHHVEYHIGPIDKKDKRDQQTKNGSD